MEWCASVSTDPIATRERQQTARAGRGVSTLQPSWPTDFTWLHCEKDPDLPAGRCPTESEHELVCRGCTQCSRLYCREQRNRTGNVFSAGFGSRTFKRAECLRHADRWHRKERGSHSVPTLLTKEAEKVEGTRYPGERPVDHDLRSEEYGPGGWTDEQQQIWIVIVKDSS